MGTWYVTEGCAEEAMTADVGYPYSDDNAVGYFRSEAAVFGSVFGCLKFHVDVACLAL